MAEHDLMGFAYPKLDDAQIQRIARATGAELRRHAGGDKLFEAGERDFRFFIIRSGEVDILDPGEENPQPIVTHAPGEFTGDVSHLTGSPAFFTAVARGDCETYEVSSEGLRLILEECAEIADILLQAFIARRQLLRESGSFSGLRVIGSRYSRDTFRIREFLARNRVLFSWLDLDADGQIDHLLRRFGISETDTPVVMFGRKLLLRNPSNRELADALGLHRPVEKTIHDLVVVGAGPAGLAAAVYGASEGLRTIVLERSGPGGQAGASMRIENYLGFPTGLTGAELAERAVLQADRFGAQLTVPVQVTRLAFEGCYPVIHLDDGSSITAKCLLIASGARYRRLVEQGCERFEGTGVYYAATSTEEPLCRNADVVVVGGGNSAGQAAVYLSGIARHVYLVVRGDSLTRDMSAYLARRIAHSSKIEVLLDTKVLRMDGDKHLARVELVNRRTGERRVIETPALFSFIGAVPNADWVGPEIARDSRGFICTGPVGRRAGDNARDPFLLETSCRGVFAAGDVRAESVKRVASAVGEGAMAVRFVHEALKER